MNLILKNIISYTLSYFLIFTIIVIPTNNIQARELGRASSIMGSTPCRVDAVSSTRDLSRVSDQVSQSVLLEVAWPCAKGIFMGAWEATGGLVVSAGKCIWSPIKCARKAKAALKNAYDLFSNIGEKVSQAFASFSQMPAQAKASIICSIIGGIGADVVLAILTAGAASGKLGLTLARITAKLSKLAKMARSFTSIPISKIAHLSQGYLNKLSYLLRNGKERLVQRLIRQGCK